MTLAVLAAGLAVALGYGWKISAQAPARHKRRPASTTAPDAIVANSYPNPFTTIPDFFKMPAGRKWGSTARRRHRQGRQDRLDHRSLRRNSCYNAATGKMSDLDPILHFDENGN